MVVAQQPAHCSFSTRITAPASRRRKAAEKEEEKEQTPDYDFYSEAGRMIDKIRKAVEPMQSINSGFTVVTGGEHALLVTSERGKFVFDTDEVHYTLSMQSYVSGKHFYAFDSSEGVWLSVKDGHDIRGLLTRDLLKHCAGCPIIV
jgi:frataxin-like iron-binding protein CyaY